ncbi:hypothetical protein HPB47_018006, partial [Ixodes persulcatus]
PVAGNLAKHVAIWKMTVCASLVASVSLAACFFGNSLPFLVVFLGILHGTSLGFLSLFNTVIGQHFSRYRAIASGIASSGYTIGGLIFPPVFQVLFDEYGTRGGLLLLPMFYLIALSYAQIVFNMSTYLTVIVDFATDRDVPKWDAVLFLAIYGAADVASRFGSGWISDNKCIKRSAVMSLHFFLWSASYFMLASANHFPFHVVSAITAGWSNGATSMLVPVLVMELVDAQQFSFCFGFVTLIIVLPFCLRPLMI